MVAEFTSAFLLKKYGRDNWFRADFLWGYPGVGGQVVWDDIGAGGERCAS